MGKAFSYFRKTREIYRDTTFGREWDGDEGYDFTYEPDEKDLKGAVVDLLYETYFKEEGFNGNQRLAIKEALKNFTDDNNNWEELYEYFEDELKEMFEDEAMESENND